jgi:hypothetical protein
LDFLPPQSFLDFCSIFIYFSHAGDGFQRYFLFGKSAAAWGPPVTLLPQPGSHAACVCSAHTDLKASVSPTTSVRTPATALYEPRCRSALVQSYQRFTPGRRLLPSPEPDAPALFLSSRSSVEPPSVCSTAAVPHCRGSAPPFSLGKEPSMMSCLSTLPIGLPHAIPPPPHVTASRRGVQPKLPPDEALAHHQPRLLCVPGHCVSSLLLAWYGHALHTELLHTMCYCSALPAYRR